MRAHLSRLARDERVRFLVVGGVNTGLAYVLFLAFEQLTAGHYLVSLALSYLIATIVAFALHRRITFGVTGRERILVDFARFESVYVVMLIVNAVFLHLLVARAGWPSWIAQAAIVAVTTTMSYLGHKFYSFRRTPEAPARPVERV